MEIIMPQLGETVLEGTVSAWYKKPGEHIAADESLFEVETEKVSTEIPSPVAGVLRKILVEAGTTVPVGTPLAVVDPIGTLAGAQASSSAPAASVPGADRAAPGDTASVAGPSSFPAAGAALVRAQGQRLSPVVRRLLGESRIDPGRIQGSGRDGRITREDVLAYLASPVQQGSAGRAAEPAAALREAASPVAAGADDHVVPLNKIRRATAVHMLRSVTTSPHTLQAVEVDFHGVEKARRARGAQWKAQQGFALTYLPFICVAVCDAIAEFPLVNASFGREELIVHRRVHLGIAVDLSFDGLVAPVLRDADRRNLRALALDIATLIARARANSLTPDELQGGTYTISNSGSFGTLITAPIINQPQVAILSLDGVHKKPVVIEGSEGDAIAIRPVGVLAQSFDHRAFDGAYSAAFLRRVKISLETRDWLAEIG